MPLLLLLFLWILPIVGAAQPPNFQNRYQIQLTSSPNYDLSKLKIEMQIQGVDVPTTPTKPTKQAYANKTLTIEFPLNYHHTLLLYLTCPNQQTQQLDSLCLLFLPSPVLATNFQIKAFPFQKGMLIPMFKPEVPLTSAALEKAPKNYTIGFNELIALEAFLPQKVDTSTTIQIIEQHLQYQHLATGAYEVFSGAPKQQPIDAIDSEQLFLYKNGTFIYLRTVPNIDHSNNYYSAGNWQQQGKYLILRSGVVKAQMMDYRLGYFTDFTFGIWKRQGKRLVPLQTFLSPMYFNLWPLKSAS